LARELADFDWLCERVSQSAAGFDGAPVHWLSDGVQLSLAPSLRMHRAPWAVDELRQRLLAGQAAAAIVMEPLRLALWRAPEGVAMRRLSAAATTLIETLMSGAILDEALGAAAGVAVAEGDASAALAVTLEEEVLRAGFARITVAAAGNQ
jgi:hypothetical protein